jgi:hypothetical protein
MWWWSIYKNIFPRYLELHRCVIFPDANGGGQYKTLMQIVVFLCAACLPASFIKHVSISELLAQWHWCWHFSMSLNSQCFLQFHPMVMLVAYSNSCFIIIRKNFFPDSYSSRISSNSRATRRKIFSATTDIAHA